MKEHQTNPVSKVIQKTKKQVGREDDFNVHEGTERLLILHLSKESIGSDTQHTGLQLVLN